MVNWSAVDADPLGLLTEVRGPEVEWQRVRWHM